VAEHPGNEGPFLLDQDGQPRILKVTTHPEQLHFRIGNLEIHCEGESSGQALSFIGSNIFVDGQPFPVRSLVLRGSVTSPWTVELEFCPRASRSPSSGDTGASEVAADRVIDVGDSSLSQGR
jgi:hypothetical protein